MVSVKVSVDHNIDFVRLDSNSSQRSIQPLLVGLTRDQYALPKEERKKNLVRAFSIEGSGKALRGKRVLLVDDLYTTGNTAREASKTIARAKTKEILFFALARTP